MKLLGLLVALSVALLAMVDINHASEKELTKLKGIGAKKATSIVEYRKENGCFQTSSGIIKVKGIGKKILEKNQDNLEVKPCKKVKK